jgi:hypothetical protein
MVEFFVTKCADFLINPQRLAGVWGEFVDYTGFETSEFKPNIEPTCSGEQGD